MYVRDILKTKGRQVHTISPDASCDDAATELVRLNIGSLLVCDAPGCHILGIITERDILRVLTAHECPLHLRPINDVMSRELVTAQLDDHIILAMVLMTKHYVRHLPVVECGDLCGLISIGDIVGAHHDELELENHYLRSYIRGQGDESFSPLN